MMSHAKTIDLINPARTSFIKIFCDNWLQKRLDEISRYASDTRNPPKIPVAVDSIVRMGMVSVMAQNLGTTTYWMGLIPIVFSASISSPTIMVAISAVVALPVLPASIMAVRMG